MIIGPLIKGHEMEPCWQCWLKHLEYLTIITQHVITEAELTTVERLISAHQQAFAKVPEYEGLDKPKHHMVFYSLRRKILVRVNRALSQTRRSRGMV